MVNGHIVYNANSIFDIFQGEGGGGRGCSRAGEGEGEDFSLATAFFYCLSLATTVGKLQDEDEGENFYLVTSSVYLIDSITCDRCQSVVLTKLISTSVLKFS